MCVRLLVGDARRARAFFGAHGYFGLERADVVFFEQGTLPALSLGASGGKLLMEHGGAVALAPDGNGGLWRALAKTGALADMAARGVLCARARARGLSRSTSRGAS